MELTGNPRAKQMAFDHKLKLMERDLRLELVPFFGGIEKKCNVTGACEKKKTKNTEERERSKICRLRRGSAECSLQRITDCSRNDVVVSIGSSIERETQ